MPFLLGLTALFFLPILLNGGSVGNFGDLYLYVIPFRHFATASLESGQMPLWNPYIFSGTPFLATPQSALFYPGTLLFHFFSVEKACSLFAFFHLFLNAFGMFLFLRALGMKRSASLAGSSCWGFSFYFLSKIAAGHLIHLSGYSWFCVCLTLLLNRRFIPIAAAASALMFLSGHLQVWVVGFLFLAALLFARALSGKLLLKNHWKQAGLGFAVFGGIVFLQGFPTAVFSLRSFRAALSDVLGRDGLFQFAATYSMDWKALTTLVIPDWFGNPMNGTFEVSSFPSEYLECYALYFGILPLCLGLASLGDLIRRKKILIPSLALLFLILAAGNHSIVFTWTWKLFSGLRVPARFYVIFLFLLSSAAAMFWSRKVSGTSSRIKLSLWLMIALDLIISGRKFIWAENYDRILHKSSLLTELSNESMRNSKGFRILTGPHIGNPNKTMFSRVLNLNGYEALWQGDLMRLAVASEGIESVSTTGLRNLNPENARFRPLGIKYFIAEEKGPAKWKIRLKSKTLTIFEDPSPSGLAWAVANQPGGPPPVENVLHLRRTPNKILTSWTGSRQVSFNAVLSEAYYPGWECWSDRGDRLAVKISGGYVMSALHDKFDPPYQKLYWIFRPKDFILGAWISAFTVAWLAVLGAFFSRRAIQEHNT